MPSPRSLTHGLAVTVTLAVAFLLIPLAFAQQFEATMGHPHQTYSVIGAEAFKNHVESATDGQVQVNLIRHGALGGDLREITDQLRLGELEFNIPGVDGMAGVFPQAQVYNWPFMFTNRSAFWSLMQDPAYVGYVRDELLSASNDTLLFLGAAENSIRHMYTTRGPIRVPSDLTEYRIKMRTQPAPMHQRLFEELGSAAVVAVSAPERYGALQSGLIDGLEGGLASAWDAGLLEVATYVSLTGHMYDYLWLIANNDFYQSLPEAYQQVVDEAAFIAATVINAYSVVESNDALAKMYDAGLNVYVPTNEELAEWQRLAEPIGRQFIEQEVPADFIATTLEALERVRAQQADRTGR